MSDDQNLTKNQRLDGSVALITGASSNIGRGIARHLAGAGSSVVLHYFSGREPAESAAEEIRATGATACALGADLRNESEVRGMFDELEQRGMLVDRLVNNAGAYPVQAIADMSGEEFRDVVAANLDSAFLVSRHAAERMRTAGRAGAIVNIASIEGSDPAPGHVHYASSKSAMIMLTRSFAMEYGSAGIRVNAVSPGLIDRDGLAEDWPDGVERWLGKAPLGRLGTSGDVASAVAFLLSPAAEWISGANLVVDGGMSAAARW